MNRFLVAIVLGSAVILTILLGNLIADMDLVVRDADSAIRQTSQDLHGTSQNLNAALIQLGLATDQLQDASREQRRYWNQTARDTRMAVQSVQSLVRESEDLLTHKLTPDADEALRNASTLEGQANVDLLALNEAIIEGTAAAHAARTRLEDPQLGATTQSLAAAATNVAAGTQSLAAAAHDIQQKVHQMTQPARFAVRVGTTVLDLGSKVGAVLAGVK